MDATPASGARGLFVAIEGPDGSGKSTQAALLVRWLEERGGAPLSIREPGGTDAGERIRSIVLEEGELEARAELLLMLAARAALVEERIRPALEDGRVVVADRFSLSTLAYQGFGRGIPLDEVRRLNRFATGGLEPDITFLLEVPPEVGEARLRAGRAATDRIESAGADFHARVAEAYGLLAGTEGGMERVDGTASPERVHARIVEALRGRHPETFPGGPG